MAIGAEDTLSSRLEKIALLKEDWDGYNSPAISKRSLIHSKQIIKLFDKDTISGLTIWPNEYGGVLLRYCNGDKTIFACDIGDECMSYYITFPGKKTLDFAFIEYSEQSMSELSMRLAELINYCRKNK